MASDPTNSTLMPTGDCEARSTVRSQGPIDYNLLHTPGRQDPQPALGLQKQSGRDTHSLEAEIGGQATDALADLLRLSSGGAGGRVTVFRDQHEIVLGPL